MMTPFVQKLRAGHEGNCPECGRHAQIYYRRIHASIALQIVQLYKLGGDTMYVHTSKLIPKGGCGVGDFSKAKYWGLIEEKTALSSKQKSSGYWMLTKLGIEFVTNDAKLPKFALVYDDKVIDMMGSLVSISDCLIHKFDYDELMAGENA